MSRKSWVWVAAIIVMFVAIRYARCPIYSLGWHAVHGDLTRCGNFKIRVPAGWWAASEDQVCVVITWEPQYALGGQKPIQVTFHQVADAPSPSNQQWKEDLTNRLRGEGYVVTGSFDLVVAGKKALCLESYMPLKSPPNYVMCDVEQGLITYIAYDDARWKEEFYRILRNIS